MDDDQSQVKKMPDSEYKCSRCHENFCLEPMIYEFLVESEAEVEIILCYNCLGQVEMVTGDLEFPIYH